MLVRNESHLIREKKVSKTGKCIFFWDRLKMKECIFLWDAGSIIFGKLIIYFTNSFHSQLLWNLYEKYNSHFTNFSLPIFLTKSNNLLKLAPIKDGTINVEKREYYHWKWLFLYFTAKGKILILIAIIYQSYWKKSELLHPFHWRWPTFLFSLSHPRWLITKSRNPFIPTLFPLSYFTLST